MNDKVEGVFVLSEVDVIKISEMIIERIEGPLTTKITENIKNTLFINIGKTVFNKLLWFLGAVCVGLFYFLSDKGFIKP